LIRRDRVAAAQRLRDEHLRALRES
jgi:hypothetical protein